MQKIGRKWLFMLKKENLFKFIVACFVILLFSGAAFVVKSGVFITASEEQGESALSSCPSEDVSKGSIPRPLGRECVSEANTKWVLRLWLERLIPFIPDVRRGLSSYDNSIDEAYWKERVREKGGAVAYTELGDFIKTQPTKFQHRISHMFGAALFSELGLGAFYVCDFRYESGCLHEFFRQFARQFEMTPSVLVQLAHDCALANGFSGPCEHAIGHGLITYLGYNKKALNEALSICDTYFTSDLVLGCAGGVFMEYNGYVLFDEETRPREVKNDDFYEPCDGINEKYQRACTWWLPRWWNEFLTMEPRALSLELLYKKIGGLCTNLPKQSYRRECFEAIGQKVAVITDWDSKKIKKLCALAATTSEDNLYCLSYAASMFIYVGEVHTQSAGDVALSDSVMRSDTGLETRQRAQEVCGDLSPKYKEFCTAYANNERYIYNELPLPEIL